MKIQVTLINEEGSEVVTCDQHKNVLDLMRDAKSNGLLTATKGGDSKVIVYNFENVVSVQEA